MKEPILEPAFEYLIPALRVMSGGGAGQLNLVRAAEAPASNVVESYAVVPRFSDPRVLMPLAATPAVWRSVLRQYAAGAASPVARAAARVLGAASWVGMTPLFLRDRVSVVTDRRDIRATPLHGFLAKVLGRDDFVVSLRLAPGRPNSKPVVQVVARDGSVLAYAKFGWDELTRRLVRREADVLTELGPLCRKTPIRVPEILHKGPWTDFETLIVAPLVGSGRTPRAVSDIPAAAIQALAALRPPLTARLGESAVWRRIRAEAKDFAPAMPAHARQVVEAACQSVESRWGDTPVRLGQSHGDWIPPNISVLAGGACNIWDWERGDPDAPLGIDTMQFILFLELRRQFAEKAVCQRLEAFGREALGSQGLNPRDAHMLLTLSLLRSLLWFGEARKSGRSEDEDSRFTRTLEECLRYGPSPNSPQESGVHLNVKGHGTRELHGSAVGNAVPHDESAPTLSGT